MTQLHPGSAVQVMTIGIVLLLFWRRVNIGHVVLSGTLFLISYIPYLLYLAGTGWGDLQAIIGISGQEATWSIASVLLSLDLLHAQGLFRAVPYVTRFDHLATFLFVIAFVVTTFVVATSVAAGRRPVKTHNGESDLQPLTTKVVDDVAIVSTNATNSALLILLLWFLAPLLFYLRSSVYLQNYYLLSQWPAHFVLLGIGLGCVAQWGLRIRASLPRTAYWLLTTVYYILPFSLIAYQIYFNLTYQDARAAGDGTLIQIHHMRETIAQSRILLEQYPACDLVVLSEGHQVENSKLALLQEFTEPERILLADGETAVPLPTPCAIYLDARPGSRASQWVAANATPLLETAVTVREETWRFYQRETAAASNQPLAEWENGAALVGYERGELVPGQPLSLTLEWQLTARPPEQLLHIGTYLLTADNQVVAQHDGPGFDSIQWREGDGFISWFEIPVAAELPPGEYQLAVALYTWPDLVRINLLSGESTAFLETVSFGSQEP